MEIKDPAPTGERPGGQPWGQLGGPRRIPQYRVGHCRSPPKQEQNSNSQVASGVSYGVSWVGSWWSPWRLITLGGILGGVLGGCPGDILGYPGFFFSANGPFFTVQTKAPPKFHPPSSENKIPGFSRRHTVESRVECGPGLPQNLVKICG